MTHHILAVIPARGGSKGISHKNIADLGGKPLIAWTIEAALRSRYISRTIVSTDSKTISEVCVSLGVEVPFMRPKNLSKDTTPAIDVDLHALEWASNQGDNVHYLLHLQPTSPFRTTEDIDAAIELAFKKDADAVVSLVESSSHPYWMKIITPDGRVCDFMDAPKFTRRQDLPIVYTINGAIYMTKPQLLMEHKTWYFQNTYAYIMPKIHSLDIDTLEDLQIARYIAGGISR